MRQQLTDLVARLVDFGRGDIQGLGDVRDAVAAQFVEVVGDDTVAELVLALLPLQLQQQALAQVARADAGWFEALDRKSVV